MAPLAMEMVRDIDKDTVDFSANYDGRTQEPTILPSRFPNLLVNGSAGIAVGMATNIPPHNLREVADGVQWLPGAPGGRPRGAARRADRAGQGPGLPDRRADHGHARHRGRVPHRPRLDHDARRRRGRGDPEPALPGGHRAAVPGEPGQPGAEDRRAGEGRPGRRHRRHPRRDLRPHRPAAGDRAQARRRREGRAEQPLQAHPAAGHLRRQHARAGRRRAAHAAASTRSSGTGSTTSSRSSSGAPATGCARPRSEAHILRGYAQGARRAGRGDRADPRLGRRSRTRATG